MSDGFAASTIAAIKAQLSGDVATGKPRTPRRDSVLEKRRQREDKAINRGDGRRRERKKISATVQLNMKVEPEFKDFVQALADKHDVSMVDVVRKGVYLLHEQDEKVIT